MREVGLAGGTEKMSKRKLDALRTGAHQSRIWLCERQKAHETFAGEVAFGPIIGGDQTCPRQCVEGKEEVRATREGGGDAFRCIGEARKQ